MHGLVHPKRFDVRIIQHAAADTGHLLRPVDGGELDELRLAGRLEAFEQVREREAVPRDHHRPALDAAHPVDALFERMRLEDVFERVCSRLRAQAFDGDAPGRRLERAALPDGVALVRSELVVVRVGRDGLLRRRRVRGRGHPRRARPGNRAGADTSRAA